MKKITFILAVVIGLTSFCPKPKKQYRWDNKILIDTAGMRLFNMRSDSTSIHALIKIKRPADKELGPHRSAPEMQKVTVVGFVVMDGKENDSDYHMVITNTQHDSLVAEIPKPAFNKLKDFPDLNKKYAKARNFFLNNIDSSPGDIAPCSNGRVKVKITGFLFFDKKAHATGHSHNGVEIHPVLEITKAK